MTKHTIRVVELFAGVGGFRIGLEGASDAYETIWNNQWEPSTQHQDCPSCPCGHYTMNVPPYLVPHLDTAADAIFFLSDLKSQQQPANVWYNVCVAKSRFNQQQRKDNMKKSLIAICALVSFAASAAWEQAGTIKVADASTFTKAVAKLGEMTGNQMLGAMTMGFFANPPGSEFFGPMRPGAAAMLPVFIDRAALDKNWDEIDNPVAFAVLYPTVQPKAEFLKAHPDAVETNGLIFVKVGPFSADETYVGFSANGKWAAASDKPWQVKAALAEIAEAEKPIGGDLVRICVAEKGMAALRKALAGLTAEAKKNKQPHDNRIEAFLAGVANFSLGLAVSDKGIDLHGTIKPVAGTYRNPDGVPVQFRPLA